MNHVIHKCEDETCYQCTRGLSWCTVCTGTESSLAAFCPGRVLTFDELDAISAGLLDFDETGKALKANGAPTTPSAPRLTAEEQEALNKRLALDAKKNTLRALGVPQQAQRLAVLKETKEYYEALADAISGEIAILSGVFYTSAMESNTPSIRVGGALFTDQRERIISPDTDYRPTVKDQVEMFKWLRERDLGGFIKETIHPATLASFVSKQKDANAELPPEKVLAVFTVETAKVQRAPTRAQKAEKETA